MVIKKALKKMMRRQRMAALQMTATRCWTLREKPETLTETGTCQTLSNVLIFARDRSRLEGLLSIVIGAPLRDTLPLDTHSEHSSCACARRVDHLPWLLMQ